ncbi:DUF1249 domain-containing protein [Abyssogena phaseoliformis symbiont]|uniref:DUF1249 domain-containing protein n=1 Tax=Abyssogena phaseoliformis symbiont TaxID=596095 RepID=UPI001914F526|nr:DUF1249 domain-containing protein [Abyssogena phaseoliformis symbiont]MBW5288924.1 hypothetical protein [Candidatus Ruthia sp. Apha_13_S6]
MDIEQHFLKSLHNQQEPKTYTQVSQLFELNYQKILKLMLLLKQTPDDCIIKHNSKNDLHLIVEDRFAHTGVFTLTHKLKSDTGNINKPDIKFKIYFDAQLLEVISVCNQTTLNHAHPYLAQYSDMNIQ